MGKTQYPLSILVAPSLVGKLSEKIRGWREKGHTVEMECGDHWWKHDLILGPNTWLMTEDHIEYADNALEAAQKRVYPVEKRRKK